MQRLFLLILVAFFSLNLSAQYQIGLVPRESPDRSVFKKVGYTDVEVTYGSPSVKGRTIWGELEAFNKVWRAGANYATTISFSNEVLIDGIALDSGTYSFFLIPRENDKWTAIFNKVARQWGAFRYNAEDDALRLDIIPRKTESHTENLEYAIDHLGYQYGTVRMNWDWLEIAIPFETDYLRSFETEVQSRAEAQPESIRWVVFLQGAEHLYEIQKKHQLALSWIDHAEAIMGATTEWNDQFYPRDYVKGHLYWTKAKLLAAGLEFAKATASAEIMKGLENPIFYERESNSEEIDSMIQIWVKQSEKN